MEYRNTQHFPKTRKLYTFHKCPHCHQLWNLYDIEIIYVDYREYIRCNLCSVLLLKKYFEKNNNKYEIIHIQNCESS
jgi:phage FluMu protein Com